MSDIHANPDEIQAFAHRLASFEHEVRDQLGKLNTAFDQLSESWIDEQHERYTEEYKEMLQPLVRLLDSSQEHVMHLIRKSDELNTYLQR